MVRGPSNKQNLLRHGYLTLAALILHTLLIFAVMVPSFSDGLREIGELSLFSSFTVWSHEILGTVAEILAFIIIVPWLYRKPSTMTCIKMKKWMLPTFVIWIIAVINGTMVHVLGLL